MQALVTQIQKAMLLQEDRLLTPTTDKYESPHRNHKQ